MCGRTFLHSDDGNMNVKDDARVGQKTASKRFVAMVCTVARYAFEPFCGDTVVARPWMRCQGHVAHSVRRLISVALARETSFWCNGLAP